MKQMKQIFLFSALTLFLLSCSPKYIKGTNLEDTDENRAVFKVFQNYVMAIKEKNTDKILSLVSPEYFDTNGTDEPGDDVDYKALSAFLQTDDFNQILQIKVLFIIKELTVIENHAKILFYYEARFKKDQETIAKENRSLLNQHGEKWLRVNDVNLMELKKDSGNDWKIISGL